MQALAKENGDLNNELLVKTKGITLLWYLLSTEIDFLVFSISGFIAISLLYVKQVLFYVFNLSQPVDLNRENETDISCSDETLESHTSSCSFEPKSSESDSDLEFDPIPSEDDSSNSRQEQQKCGEIEREASQAAGSSKEGD